MENLLASLRAAGEETRLRILGLLGHGELAVSDLVTILDQSQPRISRHLKLLMEAGLVVRQSEGTWAFFRLANKGLNGDLAETFLSHIPKTDKTLKADLKKLAEVREMRAKEAESYFEKVATDWDSIRGLYIPEEKVEAKLKDILSRYSITNFLDVGTGTGRILEIFSDLYENGIGVDRSQHMLAVARETLKTKKITNSSLQLGDMYDLGLDNLSQDAIVFHQVLHFAENPKAVLMEASRVLKECGVLVIADFALHDEGFLREEHNHRRLGFGESEINELGIKAGLTPLSCQSLEGEKLTVLVWEFTK